MLDRKTTAHGVDMYAMSFNCYSPILISHEMFFSLAISEILMTDLNTEVSVYFYYSLLIYRRE